MGFAWWALDYPFLYRHSAEYLKEHPEQKGKDFEATRKACEKFGYCSHQRDLVLYYGKSIMFLTCTPLFFMLTNINIKILYF